MNWIPHHLPFEQTGYFSPLITDYLKEVKALQPFYAHPVTREGIQASIAARKQAPVNRSVLVEVLREQYRDVADSATVRQNIDKLLDENTFTIVTAHQPAIFTGTLYFVYKILHTIRLAEQLSKEQPENHFVPVFYMGSEDADLDELGNIFMGGERLVWETKQKGAVGRMKPKGLEKILVRIEGELAVLPFGPELVSMLKEIYLESPNIQVATLQLIHRLFGAYGIVVLIPDHGSLKSLMQGIFEEDLFENTPSELVNGTIKEFPANYKVQANPRAINLFYLKDDLRGRIERVGHEFVVHDSDIRFDEAGIREELRAFPERFSPNVILRGLFQETILPNIAFIGGGGETAYWLELKGLFDHYKVPFPVLILRNSFLLIEQKWKEKLDHTQLSIHDIFRSQETLVNELVRRESNQQLSLETELADAESYYGKLKTLAGSVDPTLGQHVAALHAKALQPLKELEKKLLKAERRKFGDQQRQIHAIKTGLFPRNNLQERIDNFMPWYAQRGPQFITDLYKYSPGLPPQFIVLSEEASDRLFL